MASSPICDKVLRFQDVPYKYSVYFAGGVPILQWYLHPIFTVRIHMGLPWQLNGLIGKLNNLTYKAIACGLDYVTVSDCIELLDGLNGSSK